MLDLKLSNCSKGVKELPLLCLANAKLYRKYLDKFISSQFKVINWSSDNSSKKNVNTILSERKFEEKIGLYANTVWKDKYFHQNIV